MILANGDGVDDTATVVDELGTRDRAADPPLRARARTPRALALAVTPWLLVAVASPATSFTIAMTVAGERATTRAPARSATAIT